MISAVMRSLDITFLDGNMFMQVTMYFTSDLVVNFVMFLMSWSGNHTSLAP